jgi:hypothetical protein
MVFWRAIYCTLSEGYKFGPHLHPVFLWSSFSKQAIFLPQHRSPNILSLNLPDKILCFKFTNQTYITCSVHYMLSPLYAQSISFILTLISIKTFDWIPNIIKFIMYIFQHPIITALHPLSRSGLSILHETYTFQSYTRRTRLIVYALRNRRKYYRRHIFSAYRILNWKITCGSLADWQRNKTNNPP